MNETTYRILGLIFILIGIYTSKCEMNKVRNGLRPTRVRLLFGHQKNHSLCFYDCLSYSKLQNLEMVLPWDQN